MEELLTTEQLVKEMLIKYPDTRNSDALLYVTICKILQPSITKKSCEDVLLNAKELGVPNYDTVSRARRKVQAKNKSLRPAERVNTKRYKRWKVFVEYATE